MLTDFLFGGGGETQTELIAMAQYLVLWNGGWKVEGSNPISHMGFFSPNHLASSVGSAMCSMGRLQIHNQASFTSWMRF